MVEAVFDFASINRRMNRKPDVVAAVELQSQKETITHWYGVDPANEGSEKTTVYDTISGKTYKLARYIPPPIDVDYYNRYLNMKTEVIEELTSLYVNKDWMR